jgi:protein arginine N-methyltransferase 3
VSITDLPSATRRIRALEKRLVDAKRDLTDYRAFVEERLNKTFMTEALDDLTSPPRDDDSHYFESYGENGTISESSSFFFKNNTILMQFKQISMRS